MGLPRVLLFATIIGLFPVCLGADTADIDASNCWEAAGQRFGVDPWLLYAIAEQESSLNPVAVNVNGHDGTEDVGIMQINSWWLADERLGQYINRQALFDPCTNINVGAWIVAHNFSIYGKTWDAIGAYNAGTKNSKSAEAARKRYAGLVRAIYERNLGGL